MCVQDTLIYIVAYCLSYCLHFDLFYISLAMQSISITVLLCFFGIFIVDGSPLDGLSKYFDMLLQVRRES